MYGKEESSKFLFHVNSGRWQTNAATLPLTLQSPCVLILTSAAVSIPATSLGEHVSFLQKIHTFPLLSQLAAPSFRFRFRC